MTTETLSQTAEITKVTYLSPKPDRRLKRPRQNDDVTGKPDNFIEWLISHRLRLSPAETVDPDFYAHRAEQTGYLYRRSALGRNARLVYGAYGSENKGGYMVETRWATKPKNLLHALSFLTRHGDWMLVNFNQPTEVPPERIDMRGKRRNVRSGRRPIQAPAAAR